MSEMISVKVAAAMLSLSKGQVYVLLKEKELPFAQLGRAKRLFKKDVENYVRLRYNGDDLSAVTMEPAKAAA